MELEEKAKEVEVVFAELDKQIEAFQSTTNLHCKLGCGKCCFKPDIEATTLELLPLAFHLHKLGKAEEWLDKLGELDSSICYILNPTQNKVGMCSEYAHRALICRLFGYSARTNKYGKKELITCQIIKSEQEEAYVKVVTEIDGGLPVPVMNQFYMQLQSIDYELTKTFYPINEALKNALETVCQYYVYR